MARVRVDLPDSFLFSTLLTVRVSDLNYGAHLSNDAVLRLAHEARVRLLRAHGLGEGELAGTRLLLANATIVFAAEAFVGDELRIDVALTDMRRVTCDMAYRMTRTNDDRLIAKLRTGLAFIDKATGSIAEIPDVVRALIADETVA